MELTIKSAIEVMIELAIELTIESTIALANELAIELTVEIVGEATGNDLESISSDLQRSVQGLTARLAGPNEDGGPDA